MFSSFAQPSSVADRATPNMKRSKNSKRCGYERNVCQKTSQSDSAQSHVLSVAYIDLPRTCWRQSKLNLELAVQNCLAVGATIINATFEREADGRELYDTISAVLTSFWGSDFRSEYAQKGTVMTFYSCAHWQFIRSKTIDPEVKSPALMLTFRDRQSPGSQLCVVRSDGSPRET